MPGTQGSEKHDLLAILTEGSISMQKVALEKPQEKMFKELEELEGQKTREALEQLGRKHKLVKLENERDRTRMIQGWSFQGLMVISPEPWTAPPWILAHPQWHKMRMMQCPNRLGPLWQKEKERDW